MRNAGIILIVAMGVVGMLLAGTPEKTPTSKPVSVEIPVPGKTIGTTGYPTDFHTVTSQYATTKEAYAATRAATAYLLAATRAAKDANLPH